MTHGSLFSGIGGFDLAAQWMGWENAFHCELNPFGTHVLQYYWPNATHYGDITKTDFSVWNGRIDVLSGGFPCQPFSDAGLQRGTEDERHLWPDMLRAIREISPRWVVGENVRGLIGWNGGLVFEQVQADLEAEGYEVLPFLLPACAIDAPHRRDRIWFVAHSLCSGSQKQHAASEPRVSSERVAGDDPFSTPTHWGAEWDTDQSGALRILDGLPDWVDNPTIRNGAIKALGNAIVPKMAFRLFTAIQQYDNLLKQQQ
jgi:DNA (cytosine-5)-methyltransferase 1